MNVKLCEPLPDRLIKALCELYKGTHDEIRMVEALKLTNSIEEIREIVNLTKIDYLDFEFDIISPEIIGCDAVLGIKKSEYKLSFRGETLEKFSENDRYEIYCFCEPPLEIENSWWKSVFSFWKSEENIRVIGRVYNNTIRESLIQMMDNIVIDKTLKIAYHQKTISKLHDEDLQRNFTLA